VIGNMLTKEQVNMARNPSTGEETAIPSLTYTLNCRYDAAQPHAVSFDGDRTYTYDQNGNMTEYVSSDRKQWRKLYWDDENRLIRTQDNAGTVEYAYDEGGLRSRKKSALGETLYVNPQYSVRNGEVYSKHVFAGNTRLATTMVKRKGTAATELGVYYYHGDHLGSSNVITTKTGTFHEHLEYFPYGETWVHEKAAGGSEYMAHLFTGKELDPETGLYDHGARYRDPKIGGWLSVDPPMARGEYFPSGNRERDSSLPGMGGVFNPINLNVYHYAGLNPVKFVDPDGEEDILFTKTNNPAIARFESEGHAYKDGTFDSVQFKALQKWVKVKEYFGGSIGKRDVEFFLGKADKTFSDFSTLPDDSTIYGTVQSGRVYDYRSRGFNGMMAYVLTDLKLGDRKVPQDSQYGNPIGSNPGDKGAHPSYVVGSYLHKAFFSYGKWGGSKACIIQKGFEGPNGMGAYLEKNPTGQTGRVIIFR